MSQEYAIKWKKHKVLVRKLQGRQKGILEGEGKSEWWDKVSKRVKKHSKLKKKDFFSIYSNIAEINHGISISDFPQDQPGYIF